MIKKGGGFSREGPFFLRFTQNTVIMNMICFGCTNSLHEDSSMSLITGFGLVRQRRKETMMFAGCPTMPPLIQPRNFGNPTHGRILDSSTPRCAMGQNQVILRHQNSLSHVRGSERSERASKRVSAAEGASEASSREQANE